MSAEPDAESGVDGTSGQVQPGAAEAVPAALPRQHVPQRTRTGGLWAALALSAVVLRAGRDHPRDWTHRAAADHRAPTQPRGCLEAAGTGEARASPRARQDRPQTLRNGGAYMVTRLWP
jgi:hypothetical protein